MNEVITKKLEGLINKIEIKRGEIFVDEQFIPLMPLTISINVSIEMAQDLQAIYNPTNEEVIDKLCLEIKKALLFFQFYEVKG